VSFTEWIDGDIMVSGNVCSFNKGFFAIVKGTECLVRANTLLMIELSDKKKIVRWIDQYDSEVINKQFSHCFKNHIVKEDL
jgi:hypothetical protein